MPEDVDLEQEMQRESILILQEVAWLEKLINKKTLEFQQAWQKNNIELADKLQGEVCNLLDKLGREEKIMDDFMVKYRKLVDEKEKLLSNSLKENEVHIRRIPKDEGGTPEGCLI